jgi:hypothetical protein
MTDTDASPAAPRLVILMGFTSVGEFFIRPIPRTYRFVTFKTSTLPVA